MLTLLLLWAQAAASPTMSPTLYQALSQNKSSVAEALINAGADPNSRDFHARTPLHIATIAHGKGKQDLIRLLLAKGADPNARDDSGASPLDEAVWRGSVEKSVLLLDAGAEINTPETKTGTTPLNEAAFRGHRNLIKLLLARGANPGMRDHAGFLPAENAIRQHHPEVLGILLEHESDPELPARLMTEAVRRGQPDTVQTLLDLGTDIDAKTASGSTALYEAALKGEYEIVSLLLSRGADVNALESASGTTPLYAAAAFGRGQVVSVLLLWGANPNLLSKDGIGPLRAAESNKFTKIADQLRAAGGH